MRAARRSALGGALLGMALLGACAVGAPAPPPALELRQPVVLLGEVHDNAAQHALRLAAFEALLARGARPALVLEQLDRDHQAAIDARRRQPPPPDAAELVRVGQGGRGWDWRFYEPFLRLALQHGLPIVAANVGRDATRQVMRDGLAASGFDPEVPGAVLDGLARQIEDSHCGQIGSDMARRMALAQVARDQSMARAVQAHADRGVVLLAGNGHVRTDLGVPRWLDAATRARSEAIGVLEDGDPTAAYDRRIFTPAPPARPDPCAGFKAPAR